MKNPLMLWQDKLMFCKRALTETGIDLLKNILRLNILGTVVPQTSVSTNLLCGLIVYCH